MKKQSNKNNKILFISCTPDNFFKKHLLNNNNVPQKLKSKIKKESGFDVTDWFYKALGWNKKDIKNRAITISATNNPKYPSIKNISGIIITGSPFMVGTDKCPWIKKIERYIKLAYKNNVPILGICFGHHLIAKTFGGLVKKTKSKMEVGTKKIYLTKTTQTDLLYRGLPAKINVNMFHSESVSKINNKIQKLSFNSYNPNQSIAVGKNIRGVQFHPEMTPDIIRAIIYFKKPELEKQRINVKRILNNIKPTPQAQKILKNFDKYFVLKNN